MLVKVRLSDIQNGDGSGRGLMCRKCGCRDFRVVYTRDYHDSVIRRRRQCRHCGNRMTTVEKPLGAD